MIIASIYTKVIQKFTRVRAWSRESILGEEGEM
jgi:hypothetical protein